MDQTHDSFGQGDVEAVPDANAAVFLLPRSIGQTSLVDNVNDTQSDTTLTDLVHTSSSSSTLPSASSTNVPVRESIDDLPHCSMRKELTRAF